MKKFVFCGRKDKVTMNSKPSHAIKECKAILKKLNEVQAELLRAESDHPDYADVLAAQKELYQLLFLLARKETI